MRFLTADYLFPLHRPPIKEGVLRISDNGKVLEIINNRSTVNPEVLEIFNGIICPGFVNAHCHLELSHLSETIVKHNGLLNFIKSIIKRDRILSEEIKMSIVEAEEQMLANGIVAVGDISNTADTLFQKKKGNMKYYNFIETFCIKSEGIDSALSKVIKLRDEFRDNGQKATIVPHASYSVPPKLMQNISRIFDNEDIILSIHNQETKSENELFINKRGDLFDWLNEMDASSCIWSKRKNSTDILCELNMRKILLVHNTFIRKNEITDNHYCTCPKANLYIENSLPDYSIFDHNKLCVGTDSLASNNSLSIQDELLEIQRNSDYSLNTLLKIGSKNGAEALGFDDIGTFEVGKSPGIIFIESLDKKNFLEGKLKRII